MALAVGVLLALAAVGWAVWPAPPVRAIAQVIPVVDGPADDQRVLLDTTFFPPADGGRGPAVLLAHGFGGSKRSVRDQAVRLAQAGYAVLTWSARGFGASTGEIALNSPDYEVKDVRQLIDWVARRPEVLLDAPGDPRLGLAGGSYGGAITLMAAAYDDRIDAIVPQITWYDLADALFPDATGQGPEQGVFKRMWAGLFFSRAVESPLAGADSGSGSPLTGDPGVPSPPATPLLSRPGGLPSSPTPATSPPGGASPSPGAGAGSTDQGTGAASRDKDTGQGAPGGIDGREVRCGRFLPAICDMYQQVAQTGRATPAAVETLRRSSPVSVPGKIRVPALLIQGKYDSLFPLSHADANARAIAATGAPVRVAWFDGGHDGGDGELDWVADRTIGWFDHWLKNRSGGPPPGEAFSVTRNGGRDPGTRRPVLLHAAAGRYPGLAGAARTPVPLAGPDQEVAGPPGGSPAAISTVPGMAGLLGGLGGAGLAIDMPGQAAAFESAPLTAPLEVTGTPSASVRVHGEGEVILFAKLYDVGGQRPLLPQGLVAPFRVTATPAGTPVTVTLPAIDHRFEVGHRLRLVVSTTDMGYASPIAPAVHRVGLASSTLTVPTDPALRTTGGGLGWWTWALPLAALAVAAAILLTGRVRHAGRPDPALAGVPLRITGLSKRYRDGEPAVDDLSFQVDRGQVLGLLGPNGAGKTTTMRMMMGLIHPDAGEIRIFGHRVTPGAPVLSRLGSFVEGPGFLPHLSGRENLELYWRATGRPRDDAHLPEALEIAALGSALDRAVRTYSQGMRQRLAIAQAMLGLPDLLVLDEPTNGLDPPQIAEMRRVLIRYAAGGRTVIVSSHLLSEVEQTCDHVVVMHRGRLVTAGPVSDLLGDPAAAGGSRGRLEDVFLDLIGDKA
ncbi:ABC transporter ATP-binding protein [Sphaerisporangium melleum]|uniref:ABC transporter ATP-binding protein n=1 Tax=Sphaerisporangium melleum TaxID=321316 RepID=A0A917R4T7_9ACTN|nr:ABC transporter ATP-binding protein [Sphaerisporangium melleum]GII72879.1 ABC transporter ATP-binding protein [Sphaerisporangium melleum]